MKMGKSTISTGPLSSSQTLWVYTKLRIFYTKAQQKESQKHMSFRSSQSKHLCVLFLGITRLKRTSLSNLTWNHQHIPDLVLPILFALPFLSRSIEAIYTWIIWAKQHFKACWKDMWAVLKPVGNSLCFNGWSMEISRLWEAGCLHFHKKD